MQHSLFTVHGQLTLDESVLKAISERLRSAGIGEIEATPPADSSFATFLEERRNAAVQSDQRALARELRC